MGKKKSSKPNTKRQKERNILHGKCKIIGIGEHKNIL